MLVLERECIVMDGGITVQVIEVDGNRVRLGINAPKEVSIRRSELTPKIQENERRLPTLKEK
jgi:carbon storage regulator